MYAYSQHSGKCPLFTGMLAHCTVILFYCTVLYFLFISILISDVIFLQSVTQINREKINAFLLLLAFQYPGAPRML